MKLRLLLPVAISLAVGCAAKKSESPAAPQQFAPERAAEEAPGEPTAEDEAPAPSTGKASVCTSALCEETCEGKADGCAEAFAKGCFSDQPPDAADFDCSTWKSMPAKKKRSKIGKGNAEGSTDSLEEKEEAEKPSKEERPEAQMQDELD